MRPYETLIVLSNDLGAEVRPLVQRFETLIQTNGGTLDTSHDWGNRRLAYPIKKKSDGRYFLLEYTAEPPVVSELERTLRITDGVLRFMTVQQEHTGLPQVRPKDTPAREDVPLNELRSMRESRSDDQSASSGRAAAPVEAAQVEEAKSDAETAGASDGDKTNE